MFGGLHSCRAAQVSSSALRVLCSGEAPQACMGVCIVAGQALGRLPVGVVADAPVPRRQHEGVMQGCRETVNCCRWAAQLLCITNRLQASASDGCKDATHPVFGTKHMQPSKICGWEGNASAHGLEQSSSYAPPAYTRYALWSQLAPAACCQRIAFFGTRSAMLRPSRAKTLHRSRESATHAAGEAKWPACARQCYLHCAPCLQHRCGKTPWKAADSTAMQQHH